MKSPTELIKSVLYKKDISQADLAKRLNDSPQNFGRKLKSDMSVNLLIDISKALDYNLLFDLANEIGVKYESGRLPQLTIDEMIDKRIEKYLKKK